jgi:alcohol dehydrogenase class IV
LESQIKNLLNQKKKLRKILGIGDMSLIKPEHVFKNVKSANFVTKKLIRLKIINIIVLMDANVKNLMMNELLDSFHHNLNVVKIFKYSGGEPTTEELDKFLLSISGLDYQALIGIGGGSTLDFTKALSVLSSKDLVKDSSIYQGISFEIPSKKICVCIPTTAGSGAEATKSAVMFNPKTNVKRGINNLKVLPEVVFLIPSLLDNLPGEVFYPSLFDGVTHAYESLIGISSTKATTNLSRKSLSLFKKQLSSRYLNESYNKRALEASFLAGQAICNSETGPIHALSYPLSEYLKVSHGQAISILLPKVLLFYRRIDKKLVAPLVTSLGFKNLDSLVEKIDYINGSYNRANIKNSDSVNLNIFSLRSLELKGAIKNSPINWTYENSMEIYTSIFETKRF